MILKTVIKSIPKAEQSLGTKFQISLFIDDEEVWTRQVMTPKGAHDALIYNLEKGIVVFPGE